MQDMNDRLYYRSREEMKATFRGCAFGDNEQEVRDWLKLIEDGQYDQCGWSFRGVKRASYKLLTSLQREWVMRGLDTEGIDHRNFIAHILDGARCMQLEGGTGVPEEIRQIEPWNELGLLSYLQHYDCPTPLLDFTTDIRIALFFAIQPVLGKIIHPELDQYLSVYTFHDDVMELTNSGLIAQWRKHADFRFVDSRRAASSYDVMTLVPVMVHRKSWYDQHFGMDNIFFYNNDRIRAQKGLFVSNGTATSPILGAIRDFVGENIDDPVALSSTSTYMNCVSINRKFVPLLEEWLRRNAPMCEHKHMLPKRPEHDRVKLLFQEALAAMHIEVNR